MRILHHQLQTPDGLRSIYTAVPDTSDYNRMAWKVSGITILREGSDEASVRELIAQLDLQPIIDDGLAVLLFPNPVDGKWHISNGEPTPDMKFVSGMNAFNGGAICDGWGAGPDCRYLMGIGSGAAIIHELVNCHTTSTIGCAVCAVGGEMPAWVAERATRAAMPAMLIDAGDTAVNYYLDVNKAEKKTENDYVCPFHPQQQVLFADALNAETGKRMWDMFRSTRRTNTSPVGDVDRRLLREDAHFEWHWNDTQLGDNGGIAHHWIESIPDCVKTDPTRKVPVILVSHGMGGTPIDTAEQIKIHEIGERVGFITVYLLSSEGRKWNLACDPKELSDVDYYCAMIEYLKAKYPVDETRIYTTGFSNGAGMAMIFALCCPEIIAASFPIDSTFPYATLKFFTPGNRAFAAPYVSLVQQPGQGRRPGGMAPQPESAEQNLIPLQKALEKNREKRLRLPVMYFYGTRESEYPIRKGSNQEMSYNFWKEFNGIPLKETTENLEPYAVGVNGDVVNELHPNREHPDHVYMEHIFYGPGHHDDYHFMLLVGKAHEVNSCEREMGWNFVSRFSRLADGTLVDSQEA